MKKIGGQIKQHLKKSYSLSLTAKEQSLDIFAYFHFKQVSFDNLEKFNKLKVQGTIGDLALTYSLWDFILGRLKISRFLIDGANISLALNNFSQVRKEDNAVKRAENINFFDLEDKVKDFLNIIFASKLSYSIKDLQISNSVLDLKFNSKNYNIDIQSSIQTHIDLTLESQLAKLSYLQLGEKNKSKLNIASHVESSQSLIS